MKETLEQIVTEARSKAKAEITKALMRAVIATVEELGAEWFADYADDALNECGLDDIEGTANRALEMMNEHQWEFEFEKESSGDK